MNVRIPVPRPLTGADPVPDARGGIDEEELRRVEQRAARFYSEQAVGADAALSRREEHDRLAVVRHAESMEARAIIARAQTVRAEANTRLAMFFAAGVLGAVVLAPIVLGGRQA